MDRIGNYRNPQVQKILDTFVTEEKYGKFKPIIDEIIQRRAFQYDFSVDRMQGEIENLVKNLDGFEMADDQKIEEIGYDAAAAYSKKDKKIYINTKRFKEEMLFDERDSLENQEKLVIGMRFYHFITHEIYHAISQHPNKVSGIEKKFEFMEGAVSGVGMNEIATESATTRTVLYMTEEERRNGGYMPTSGYQAVTNTSAIVASIIGTSENSLLAHSLNDSNEFEEFVLSALPKTMDDKAKERFLSGIRMKTDLLISGDVFSRSDLLPTMYPNYYKSLVDLAITIMKEEQKEPTKENVGAMYYRLAKIGVVLDASVNGFVKKGFISKEEGEMMLNNQGLSKSYAELKDIVLDTYKICKGNDFEGKSQAEIEQSLLWDIMQDPEYGTKKNRLYMEDGLQKGNWDNSVFRYAYNVIEDEIERFDQRGGNNKVLNANEQTVQQVIGEVANPNSLTSRTQRNGQEERDDR